jgi:hypothetical protein
LNYFVETKRYNNHPGIKLLQLHKPLARWLVLSSYRFSSWLLTKRIQQVIQKLHNLNIPFQYLLAIIKAACARVHAHLLLNETPVLGILFSLAYRRK